METLNDNKNRNINIPPIYVIDLYGPRAVHVIGRYPDVPEIAAYGRTLPQKVASFQKVLSEARDLEQTQKKLVTEGAAEASELHAATLRWRARMQLDLEGLDPEDIAITETKAADVVLANARHLIEVLTGRGAEVADAEQARSALEAKAESTKAAWEATQAGRAAVQNKQRELRGLAAEVHKDLVKLRKTVRLVLGSAHPDYQLLRTDRSRAAAEPPLEEETEADSTLPNDGASRPSSVG